MKATHGWWVVDSGTGKLLFFVYHNTCIDTRLNRTEKCVGKGILPSPMWWWMLMLMVVVVVVIVVVVVARLKEWSRTGRGMPRSAISAPPACVASGPGHCPQWFYF